MPTFGELLGFYGSYFYYPGISGLQLAVGLLLSIIFGIAWLASYKPPYSNIMKKNWLWIALIVSPFLTLAALTFIQIPLQSFFGESMLQTWGADSLTRWILLTSIPTIAISGLVQEGAKLVPAVAYWWSKNRKISPKTGLLIGAVAGAGFGVLESQWVLNSAFLQGWNWELIQSFGLFHTITPFWERFFVIAFQISTGALSGYGLAKGKGWQFYLIVSLLHTILNYIAILISVQVVSFLRGEILIAVWAIIVAGGVLWIRWTKVENQPAE
jgi:RsiW-degrading membrane proteinase PrsW (M82 family)